MSSGIIFQGLLLDQSHDLEKRTHQNILDFIDLLHKPANKK
jgi:hypothetical protein